jgi:ABC-type branched-subunit amino acid transport system permease subunit
VIGVLQFAILGLGIGAIDVLLGQGMILIYRGSGVINFAHGAYAMAGAYTFYELHIQRSMSFFPSLIVSVAVIAVFGAATHVLLMRRLRHASPLSRLIATLGIVGILEGAFTIWFGGNITIVPSSLPQGRIELGSVVLPEAQLWLTAICVVLTLALYLGTRYTTFGTAMTAVAENRRAAAALGWSPDLVATITWSVGAALAAVAGVLVVPLTGLSVSSLTLTVISAMAAALLGGFSSFPLTLAAGIGIGVVQSEIARYVTLTGVVDSVPFLAIMVILVVRGTSLPSRSHVLERLPSIGSGRIRPAIVIPLAAALIICITTVFPAGLSEAITVQVIAAIILLSVVVVVGYAGQLSLVQYGLAGVGGYVTAELVGNHGWPLALAIVAGVVAAAAIGILFGLPAVRTRGMNLAVVTLGLGVALQSMLFNNANLTGGFDGITVGTAYLFGINVDPIAYPKRYAIVCVLLFVLCALATANLRRGRAGRRLIAVRANERAAASVGINVTGAKLAAFAISAGMAGLGGVLLAFQSHNIVLSGFDPLSSIYAVTYTALGGIGHIASSLIGSGFVTGGIGSYILDQFGSLDEWLVLIGGTMVVLNLIQNPDGLVGQILQASKRGAAALSRTEPGRTEPGRQSRFARLGVRPRRSAPRISRHSQLTEVGPVSAMRVQPRRLDVRGLTVRFGGVTAVDGLDLTVNAGEIVGLVGPNGAGKTTVIDAVSGFVHVAHGEIALGGRRLNGVRAVGRARGGITRSFQSVELF